jgi:hypothetical protein
MISNSRGTSSLQAADPGEHQEGRGEPSDKPQDGSALSLYIKENRINKKLNTLAANLFVKVWNSAACLIISKTVLSPMPTTLGKTGLLESLSEFSASVSVPSFGETKQKTIIINRVVDPD